MINIHDCALTCAGLPGYQAWLSTPLPSMFGADATLGYYLLGLLGVVLIFLSVSGAIIWWPGLRALASGFTVRRGRGNYVRDLDLHRVVGIVAVPFMLMWGATGAAFFFHWPEQIYYALVPGTACDDPAPPTPGAGPMLSFAQAQQIALAAHPWRRGRRPGRAASRDSRRFVRVPAASGLGSVRALELLGCAVHRGGQPRRRHPGLRAGTTRCAADTTALGRRCVRRPAFRDGGVGGSPADLAAVRADPGAARDHRDDGVADQVAQQPQPSPPPAGDRRFVAGPLRQL